MSNETVRELAQVIGIPLERLLEQLTEAGLSANRPDSIVSEAEKTKLLTHLRKRHGKNDDGHSGNTPTRITLKRSKVSELKQATTPGSSTKTISVEVRKRKTYIKREVSDTDTHKSSTRTTKNETSRSTSAQSTTHQRSQAKSVEVNKVVLSAAQSTTTTESTAAKVHSTKGMTVERVKPVEMTAVVVNPEIQHAEIESQRLAEEQLKEQQRKQRLEESVQKNAEKVRRLAEAKQSAQKKKSAKPTESKAKTVEPAPVVEPPPRKPSHNRESTVTKNHVNHREATPAKSNSPRENSAPKTRDVPAERNLPLAKQLSGTRSSALLSILDEFAEREVSGGRRKTKKPKLRAKTSLPTVEAKHQFEMPVAPSVKEVIIPEHIMVSDLASKMSVKVAEVIKHLMKLGMMATINQTIDQETAVILVEEMGHKAVMQSDDDFEKELLAAVEETDDQRPVVTRAPIVTIMGHVDHGKTSLLDYIRKTRVAAGEAGGITQHIGAYQVKTDHGSVTFLDTPGHAAFTAMRARGAEITDVVIIVVAADDGVMPQTKEAVEHARAANVPIIVAINKIDKSGANPDKVMQELATIGVLAEEWGGEVQFLKISAKTGEGINDLIEALILQSEILELTAPVEGNASGLVIESRLDKGRGAVATVLVQKGTLNKGEFVLCGHEYGRVRAMFNENGKVIKSAGPCAPVEILGLSGTPNAGDRFIVVQNERVARELAEHREDKSKTSRHAAQQASKLEDVFSKMTTGETASLNLVIKTDVQGSLEALRGALVALSTSEVEVKCIYGGVGGINESDANLALASNAILMGFNVRADNTSRRMIEEKEIDLHYYSVIYDAIDEVKRAISGMLAPDIHEKIVGLAEVREVFRSPKFGQVAGCMVLEGSVKRNLPIRVLRNNVVIFEGQLESLRRFKDDANEVKMGMECGIGVKNYNDVKAGDQIEVFERIEVKREI